MSSIFKSIGRSTKDKLLSWAELDRKNGPYGKLSSESVHKAYDSGQTVYFTDGIDDLYLGTDSTGASVKIASWLRLRRVDLESWKRPTSFMFCHERSTSSPVRVDDDNQPTVQDEIVLDFHELPYEHDQMQRKSGFGGVGWKCVFGQSNKHCRQLTASDDRISAITDWKVASSGCARWVSDLPCSEQPVQGA